MMQVIRVNTAAGWESLASAWDGLAADIPFRAWTWASTWWKHYGAAGELYVLRVHDTAGELTGIAPWWLERDSLTGRTLRFLGSGEVCSDYLSLLCRSGHENEVALAVAKWLTSASSRLQDRWDLLDLDGIDAHDLPCRQLVACLQQQGCTAHEQPGLNCWRLNFPATWGEYEAQLSKSHRKQVRRLIDRELDSQRIVLHTVTSPAEWERAWPVLVELHQRRRQSLGQRGSFASPQFAAFHADVSKRLLRAGALRLHWLERQGKPIAAEYHLASQNVVYGYQAGVDPHCLDEEPGRLAAIATLRLALADGFQSFDFLRGDEPYKAHWRATPQPTVRFKIIPDRKTARLRHTMWRAAQKLKQHIIKPKDRRMPARAAAKSPLLITDQ